VIFHLIFALYLPHETVMQLGAMNVTKRLDSKRAGQE